MVKHNFHETVPKKTLNVLSRDEFLNSFHYGHPHTQKLAELYLEMEHQKYNSNSHFNGDAFGFDLKFERLY